MMDLGPAPIPSAPGFIAPGAPYAWVNSAPARCTPGSSCRPAR